MSKDLTKKLDGTLEEKVDRLIDIVQAMDRRLEAMERRLDTMDSRLEAMDSRLEAMERRLDTMDSRLEATDSRFDAMDSRLGGVEERLGSLEATVENRLKETRPIWETVQAQLADLKEFQERLREDTEKGFRIIDRRLELQPIEWSRLRGFQRDLEERVDKIEKRLD